MSTELLANNFSTTLAASCGTGDATITVAAAAPTALQTAGGQFRILVDNEYMIVTGGAATTTWTVTRGAEGSTAAAHIAPAVVAHVLTAGSLANLGGNSVSFIPASGDATGATDTAAIVAALNAFPTRTVYAIPATNGGASAVYPVGTIRLGSGDYHIGGTSDIGNIGPFVNFIGNGRNATRVFYHGSGTAIRMFNAVKPSDDNFDDIAAWHGIINGFDLDGTNASPGAVGIHYGDTEGGTLGPDLMIRNFTGGRMSNPTSLTLGTAGSGGSFAAGTYSWKVTAVGPGGAALESWGSNLVTRTMTAGQTQPLTWTAATNAIGYNIYRGASDPFEKLVAFVAGNGNTSYTDTGTVPGATAPYIPQVNVTGSVGLWLDNTVSWTENCWARVSVYNCDNNVIIDRNGGDASFEYNEFDFKVYAFPQQNGVVIRNGAGPANGSLKIRGNFGMTSASQNGASVFAVAGQSPDGFNSAIAYCRLDISAEPNDVGQGTSNAHMSIRFGNQFTLDNSIKQCFGVLSFNQGFVGSNWSQATKSSAFVYSGIIRGDVNLHPSGVTTAAGLAGHMVSGALALSEAIGFYASTTLTFHMDTGDLLVGTVTQNSTVGFDETMAGPQRKTLIISQNATGGFTLAWPKPGSPTVAAPAIYWAGGTAPTLTATANATDIFEIVTADGIHWYGRIIAQNVS